MTALETEANEGILGSGLRLGVTLYSMSAEWAAGQYDLDALLSRVASAGVGPGLEIVASQMLRTYPRVSPEFVESWHEAMDRHGLVPSAFGANLDMGRRRDRDMTEDEEFEFTDALFRAGHALGYRLIRIQSTKPSLLRRLMPLAEELDLTLGFEIHAPQTTTTDPVASIQRLYDEIDSPRLGFVADFSSSMKSMSPTLLRALSRRGLDDAGLDELQRIWAQKTPINDRAGEFAVYLSGRGFDAARLSPYDRLAFNMHGHMDPQAWSEVMDRIVHVHAKFYDIDDEGNEPAIDYPSIVAEFIRGGYQGYFSSEWEGHVFSDLGEVDPVQLVRRQHDLIRRSVAEVLR